MITDAHRGFARALVALARQHGVNAISCTFRGGPKVGWFEEAKVDWSDGRHGISAPVTLATRATETITEQTGATPQPDARTQGPSHG